MANYYKEVDMSKILYFAARNLKPKTCLDIFKNTCGKETSIDININLEKEKNALTLFRQNTKKDFFKALEQLRKYADNNKVTAKTHKIIGGALLYFNEINLASIYFEKALKINPNDLSIYYAISNYYSLWEVYNFEKAYEYLSQALNIQPHNPKTHHKLGRLYFGVDNIRSLKYFNTSRELAYNNINKYETLINKVENDMIDLFLLAKNYYKIIEIGRTIHNKEDENVCFNVALAHQNIGNMQQALKWYKKGIDICNHKNKAFYKDTDLVNNLVNVYIKTNRFQYAIKIIEVTLIHLRESYNNLIDKLDHYTNKDELKNNIENYYYIKYFNEKLNQVKIAQEKQIKYKRGFK